jgi:hypothetical protein
MENPALFLPHSEVQEKHRLEVKSNLRTLAEVFLPCSGQCTTPEGNSGKTNSLFKKLIMKRV